jgi:Flp pilus assembly protein TadD
MRLGNRILPNRLPPTPSWNLYAREVAEVARRLSDDDIGLEQKLEAQASLVGSAVSRATGTVKRSRLNELAKGATRLVPQLPNPAANPPPWYWPLTPEDQKPERRRSILSKLMPENPLLNHDREKLVSLIAASVSLPVEEKLSLLNRYGTLNSAQLAELISTLEDDQARVSNWAQNYPSECLRAAFKTQKSWATAIGDKFALYRFLASPLDGKVLFSSWEVHPLYWWLLASSLREDLQDELRAGQSEQRGMAVMPNTVNAWLDFAYYLHNSASRHLEAESAYKRAITLNQNSPGAWYNLGVLQTEQLGRYHEGEEAYRRAIELEPKYTYSWNNLVGILLRNHLGRYQEAEDVFRHAIELDPKDPYPWNGLGLCFRDIGRSQDAATSFQAGLAIVPDQPYLLWNLLEAELCYGQLEADWSKLPHALAGMRKETSFSSLLNALFLALADNDTEAVMNVKNAVIIADERDHHRCAEAALVFLLHAIAFDDQRTAIFVKKRLFAQMKCYEEHRYSLERAYFLAGFRPKLRNDLAALARELLEVGPEVIARFKDVPKPAYMLDRFRRFAYEGGTGAGDPADLPLWCFDCSEFAGQPVRS